MEILKLIGRDKALFTNDITSFKNELKNIISRSSFLVLGDANCWSKDNGLIISPFKTQQEKKTS